MAIKWDRNLEVGNPAIDAQHIQLIDMINSLLNACASGRGSDELERSLNFLIEYTVKHIADEEEWQIKIGFPDYKRHKGFHDAFKVKIGELAVQFKETGYSIIIVTQLNSAVGNWLIQHIRVEDAKIGKHAKLSAQ